MRNVIRHDRGLNQRENTPAGHRVHWSSRGRNGRGNSGFGASFIHCLSTCVRPHLGSSHRMPSSFCCVYRKYLSDYQTINELVWCSMKRLNFRLGTKSCNGQTQHHSDHCIGSLARNAGFSFALSSLQWAEWETRDGFDSRHPGGV